MKNHNDPKAMDAKMSYKKFSVIMIISFVIMYLVMFLNMDKIIHYHTSITRIYMAILMITPMAILMMTLMGNMYRNKKINMVIVVTSVVIFFIVLFGLRSQTPVNDLQYMRAMIPHHSSAIMTSKHAHITDPEVKKLSEQIIESQQREINQMEEMLTRLTKAGDSASNQRRDEAAMIKTIFRKVQSNYR